MKQIISFSFFCLCFFPQTFGQLGAEHVLAEAIKRPRIIKSIHANADDFLDLIIQNQTGELSLLIGHGDGTFDPFKVILPNEVNRFSLFDRDGDGDMDILVAKANNQLVWLENTLSESFEIEHSVIVLVTDFNSPVKFFDLDKDGDIDVIGGKGSAVFWSENLGNDTYSSIKVLSFAANGIRDLYPVDYDKDGDFDLLASTNSVGSRILENDGNLVFSDPVTIGGSVLSSQLVDLNADGNKDLLYTAANTKVGWLRNNGDGSFNDFTISNLVSYPTACHAADLDDDGDMDVLSGSNNDNKLAWYQQTSNGVFSAQKVIDDDLDNPIGIITGDFFEEDLTSIIAISATESRVKSYRKSSAEVFSHKNLISPRFDRPEFLHYLHANNDTIKDIVFGANRDKVYAAYGNCYGSFETPVIVFTAPAPYAIGELSIDDLDNDGDNDLVVDLSHSLQTDRFGYSLFQDGAFGDFEKLSSSRSSFLKIVELTGDGKKDIIQNKRSGDEGFYCYINQGGGIFDTDESFEIEGSYNSTAPLEFVDMDMDGDKDIIGTISFAATLQWTENLGNTTFADQQVFDESNQFYSDMELSDADQDGDLDIFLYRGVGDRIVWFENTGDFQFSTFHMLDQFDPATTYVKITALDVNMDGLEDIVVHTDPTDIVYQFLSLGNGEYDSPEFIIDNDNLVFQEMAADMDNDGDEDILFIDREKHRVAWYENTSLDSEIDELNFAVELSDSLVCFAEESADIFITTMPACGTYAISWENIGSNEFELINLGAGTYIYTIVDARGTSITDSVVIEQHPELLLTGGSTPSSSNASDGKAWVIPMGGLPPYSFQWSDPLMSMTDTVHNLNPGDYTVIVTDANDCQQSILLTVDFSTSSSPTLEQNISVYPTIIDQTRLYFETTQIYTGSVNIEIIDLHGKTISTISQNGLRDGDFLEVGNLNAGLYLLRIQHATFQVTKRIIKI